MIKQRRSSLLSEITLWMSSSFIVACGGEDDPASGNVGGNSEPPITSTPGTTVGANSEPQITGTPGTTVGANSEPQITGTPGSTVLQNTAYSFIPSATDTDGDALTFSIANAPPWATFDPATGRLNGTPSAAHVGSYDSIRISVGDGQSTVSLPPFRINVSATASGSATLTWNPPMQNTNGSRLTNLGGYKIYWGTAHGSYPNSVTVKNPGLATYVVEPLTPGQWFFVVTAVSITGVESAFSNVATKTIR